MVVLGFMVDLRIYGGLGDLWWGLRIYDEDLGIYDEDLGIYGGV